jgi:tetratricopeptide (TPR) repeat protein
MKNLHRYLLSCLVLLFFASCGQSTKEITGLLTQAETAIEQQPDSALHYLKAIQDPDGLRKERRMNFYLLWVQAKDKTGDSISADTIIGEVKDYFVKQEAWEKAACAAFYCGRVYAEQKDVSRAIHAYMNADTIAQRTSDTKWKGLIQHNIGGICYDDGSRNEEAADCFKKAAVYFREGNYPDYCIESLKMLGTSLLLTNQPDSAFYYQQQAIKIATDRNDTAALAALLNNLSGTYRKRGECQQAKSYGLQAIQLCPSGEALVPYLLNMAYVYEACAQYDSSMHYATQVLQLNKGDSTSATPVSVYRLLAKIEKQRRNYYEALAWQEKYTNGIFALQKKEQEQSVAGVREKYELEVVSNKNRQLEIEHLRNWRAFLLIVMGLMGVIFFMTVRYSRQKRKQKQTDERQKQLLLQRVDYFKKARVLKQDLSSLKKDNEKIFNQICRHVFDNNEGLTWDGLYEAINEYHNGVFDRMMQQFPQLNKSEFKVACLVYAGFKNDEMVDCLQLKTNTIKMKQVDIRKKLGISDRGKIGEFLRSEMTKKEGLRPLTKVYFQLFKVYEHLASIIKIFKIKRIIFFRKK